MVIGDNMALLIQDESRSGDLTRPTTAFYVYDKADNTRILLLIQL